jgi:hypothetical protein
LTPLQFKGRKVWGISWVFIRGLFPTKNVGDCGTEGRKGGEKKERIGEKERKRAKLLILM